MKKLVFLLILSTWFAVGYTKVPANRGVPAYPGVIERIQPEGDTLFTYLRGDERKHWTMTLDGWQVLENKRGRLCYAKQCKGGKLVVSRKKAHNEGRRTADEIKWLEKYGVKKEVILY